MLQFERGTNNPPASLAQSGKGGCLSWRKMEKPHGKPRRGLAFMGTQRSGAWVSALLALNFRISYRKLPSRICHKAMLDGGAAVLEAKGDEDECTIVR